MTIKWEDALAFSSPGQLQMPVIFDEDTAVALCLLADRAARFHRELFGDEFFGIEGEVVPPGVVDRGGVAAEAIMQSLGARARDELVRLKAGRAVQLSHMKPLELVALLKRVRPKTPCQEEECSLEAVLLVGDKVRCDAHALKWAITWDQPCPHCGGTIGVGLHRGEVIGSGRVRECTRAGVESFPETPRAIHLDEDGEVVEGDMHEEALTDAERNPGLCGRDE